MAATEGEGCAAPGWGRSLRRSDVEAEATGKIRVPGASATEVHAGIWELAFSALLRARTGISRFLHTIFAHRGFAEKLPEWQVWPMPLPFPEVHIKAKSRRLEDGQRKLGLNYLVTVLNWLHLGGKFADVSGIRLGCRLNKKQWAVVHRLRPLIDGWNDAGTIGPADMRRSAPKVESIEAELLRLEEVAGQAMVGLAGYWANRGRRQQSETGFAGHPGEVVGELGGKLEHVAKDVEPERLKFHGTPSFNPEPYLDYMNRRTYVSPLDYAEVVDPDDPRLPAVKIRCKKEDRLKIIEKLDSVNRLALLPARAVRRGFENGLFSLVKDNERDRMILDARRPNFCERSEERWIYTLGGIQQLQHIFMKPEQNMHMYAEDLREFYHCFQIGEQRQQRNILQAYFKPAEVAHLKAFREELLEEKEVVAALDTLAMGDTNAVAYGQVSHLSLLLRTKQFELSDFFGLRMRPSRKRWRAGLVIDDFLVLEARSSEGRDEEVKNKVEEVRRAYEAAGLPRHPGKAVEGAEKGEFWGGELDGRLGLIRPNLKRLVPLAHILLKVVGLGFCSVGLLEVIGGSIISAFQFRRRLMASVSEIYAAQRGRQRSDVLRLSGQLKEELLICVGLLAVAVIDLRLEPSELLIASDASSSKEASVQARVSRAHTEELQRHSLQKGLWNKLLSPANAYLKEHSQLEEERELPGDVYTQHPVWEEAAAVLQFEQYGKVRTSKKRRHINLGEIRAGLAAERKFAEENPCQYYVHLQDSQVSLACMIKGRSSSEAINRELKQAIPTIVGHNIRPFFGYVRSKSNPADDPTRGQEIRRPLRKPSSWWEKISEEKFDEIDLFLRSQGMHPEQVAGLPDPKELLPDLELDGRSSGELKKERGKLRRDVPKTRRSEGLKGEKGAEERSAGPIGEAEEPTRAEKMKICEEADGKDEKLKKGAESGEAVMRDRELFTVSVRGAEAVENTEDAGDAEAAERTEDGEKAERAEGHARADDSDAKKRGRETNKEDRREDEGWGEVVNKLKQFKRSQFVINPKYKDLDEALKSGPGVLDLYSGKRGFSRAITKLGCPWSLCFDLKHGVDEDLLEPSLQVTLKSLLSSSAFAAMAASPVCASFSTAITPPWRDKLHPRGVPGLTAEQEAKIDLWHRQLRFTIELVELCIQHQVHFWIENPDGSWFWKMDGELSWQDVDECAEVGDFRIDQCVYGTPWRKRTRFKTSCHLRGQKQLCRCSGKHVQLRGRSKQHGVNFTKLAESYPRRLCSVLAGAMAIDCGFADGRRHLSVADCVFSEHRRIGEAKNPGPRRSKTERDGHIDDIELLEPQTVRIRAKLWTAFRIWVDDNVGLGALDELVEAPALLVKALEAYGKAQFSGGAPLHYYRQLLAHVQREVAMCRPFMQGAWTIVSKWEIAEPTQHRTPIPEPLVIAVCALAILWKWPKFASAVLLCYYGIMRIGEVLRARRRDLLTPCDLLSDDQVLYLKINQPKSRGRGPNVQYSTFSNGKLLPFLLWNWENLGRDEPLYPLSASAFRRRWDSLLDRVGVERFHSLTPGSLRGGGCVWAHKAGVGIQELLWKMRLQHIKTLGYYLQEVTAVSILPNLTRDCRNNIAALQGVMPLLLEAMLSAQATQCLLSFFLLAERVLWRASAWSISSLLLQTFCCRGRNGCDLEKSHAGQLTAKPITALIQSLMIWRNKRESESKA